MDKTFKVVISPLKNQGTFNSINPNIPELVNKCNFFNEYDLVSQYAQIV